ncbi:PLAT domain-containing protein 3-like [Impatiens glandulifera]|uniref:PLAT domain-containing protein 3-like n=1 Tax=Impatiens glandulifera TaxID=253017 RepID=UPI001FB17AA7|nr:PLAT domain-containing protein 3-like [Impatiens glandulifera]
MAIGVINNTNFFFSSSFHLFIIIFATVSATIARSDDCVYSLYVRTGSIIKGGTNSKMSATLYDRDGWGIRINDIELWGGLMGQAYDYFERGNLDIFSGRGPCLDAPICALNLTSDGSGPNHGWYCNYVEVTATGPHMGCSQQLFTIEQWLATDTSPYELTAIRDYCGPYVSNPTVGKRVRIINGPDKSVISVI